MTSIFLSLLGAGLLSASVVAVAASVFLWLASLWSSRLLWLRRFATVVSLALVGATLGLLAALFITQRYDIAYVSAYSSTELPIPFRVAALWAGQPGSFLLWALFGLLVAQAIATCAGDEDPLAVIFTLVPVLPLLIFALLLNPFSRAFDAAGNPLTAPNGDGLNEVLLNFWMLIHPPILFAGYALLQAPFAFALAALLRGDDGVWARRALPWTLAGWAVLGLALLLGGYWSYETLGWGGYWGWDAVENSALVPWLLTTALLHAMLVRRRGGLARITVVLALMVYTAIFYATYLTRSGVLADFSIHTFAREAILPAMTVALALLLFGSSAAVVWRLRRSPTIALADRMLSRESLIVLLIIGMLVIASVIEFGTSVPLLSAIPGLGYWLQALLGGPFPLDNGSRFSLWSQPVTDGRFGLTAVFYETAVPPFVLFVLSLLTVGPLLGWRDTSYRSLLRALRFPFWLAVGILCVALLAGARGWLPLLYLTLCGFVLGTNVIMIRRALRGGWRRIGGYLAHIGFAVMLIGIVGSTSYASRDERVVLVEDEPLTLSGATMTFHGWRATPENTGVLDLTVAQGGHTQTVAAMHYFIPRRNATLTRPAIIGSLLRDLYITPIQYVAADDPNTGSVAAGGKTTVGPYTITLRDVEVPSGETTGAVNLILDVQQGAWQRSFTVTTPMPREFGSQAPRALPGLALVNDQVLRLEGVSTNLRQVRVRIEGLNLPVTPASVLVQISVKPGVALVWGGVMIMVIGGGIALLRRTADNRAAQSKGTISALPRAVLHAVAPLRNKH